MGFCDQAGNGDACDAGSRPRTNSLDAPINDYLPDFPGNQGITIRELLQHRSGLPNPSADEGSGFYAETGPTIMDTGRASVFCAGPARGPNG
ncbi:serine hydrolase [Croceicoccus marinus]|uniref:Serine hydrolase n=1 Tax=Croceicoccus marinus TaxID=450378 RepID=A0A7G6VW29_9SPHN|nr:serine hydrolase [Croceicoccus marinus]